MIEKLKEIKEKALVEIQNISDKKSLNEIKVKYLGKQGELTAILRGMRDVSPEDRPKVGALVNEVRSEIESQIEEKENRFDEEELAKSLASEKIDITEPSKFISKGAIHAVPMITDKLIDICVDMGFTVVDGPEVETDYYNFEAMNIPKNHPSRDMQDSFYITDNILLRTQTSAVQSRELETRKPPFKIISPGKTYRNDSDSTHSPVFHQCEGLVIDENVSMADLKIMLSEMMKRLYGEGTKVRFRPSFFPFTEPSIEVDVSCPNCKGDGCKTCKGTGFLEILGAGVVNPKVLDIAGIDSKKFTGFAFGMGIERTSMVLNTIPDLRTMYKNDIRFLSQLK
jgi:phenylalanyl-tRNA synthetase alpha chain